MTSRYTLSLITLFLGSLTLAGCGGGGGSSTPSYTVSAVSGMGGAISPASLKVAEGKPATFTVTVDSAFAIDTVSGCGGTLSGTTYTIDAVTADCSVTANFALSATAAPVTLGYDIKQLTFAWEPVSGATRYRLLENPDGASGWTQAGSDLTDAAASDDISVLWHDWVNAGYQVEACNGPDNATDCLLLDTANTTEVDSLNAIGYIKAPTPAANDCLGAALALSKDGDTMAVGAPGGSWYYGDPDLSTIPGGVHIYTRSNGNWVHQSYLPSPSGEVNDFNGGAVALSADGTVLVVGAALEDSADGTVTDAGAVYVYTYDGSAWSAPERLTGNETGADHFGRSVSLSDTGNTLAVGSPGENGAYLFTYNTGTGAWNTPTRLDVSGLLPGVWFGYAVALGGDGGTLAVGAPYANGDGGVYIFSGASNWSQTASVVSPSPSGSFGDAVVLSADGTTMAVGETFGDSSADFGSGRAYIFTHDGNSWSAGVILETPALNVNDEFGYSLAMSADGTEVLVGAAGEASADDGLNGDEDDNSAALAGAAYLFTYDGVSWSKATYLKAPNSEGGDEFGTSVAMSADGSTIGIGAHGESSREGGICATAECTAAQANNEQAKSGAVYLY